MGIFKKIWGYITRRSEVQDQILSTLQDQIQSRSEVQDQILSTLDQILDRLDQIQGIPAQKKAHALTISLVETFGIFGHGVLLRCREEQGEKRFAILTAAHVAIVAFKSFQYGHFQKVCFSSGIEYMIDKDKTPELFFPHEYLCQGTHDFGVLVISIKGESPDKFENLALSIDDPFVTEHFGRASDVQFKSTPTMVNELRVRLPTESKPGCSGTPLFSPRGELLSVVHGVSKHRGRRGHTRHSGDGDNLSTHVYVDVVKELGALASWGEEYAKCVCHLEFLDEKEVENPQKELKKPSNDKNAIVQEKEVENPQKELKKPSNDKNAIVQEKEVENPQKELKKPSNDKNAIVQEKEYQKPSDGAQRFYHAVIAVLEQDPESLKREAFLKDHFTLAEFCLEISRFAKLNQTKTKILADSLSSPRASTYEAVRSSNDSA